jgi:hypothetical protein
MRTVICTVAGLLAVFAVIAFAPAPLFLPKGIALPAEKVLPAISAEQVTIYQQAPSGHALFLGTVRAEMSFQTLDASVKTRLFQKVKTLAASLGANGVVIDMLVPNDGVRHMLTFIGTAIYTPIRST